MPRYERYDKGELVETYAVGSFDEDKAAKIAECRRLCAEAIEAVAPQWKQMNNIRTLMTADEVAKAEAADFFDEHVDKYRAMCEGFEQQINECRSLDDLDTVEIRY